MTCHTGLTLRAALPREPALPSQEALDELVAWDVAHGVFIIKVKAANDDRLEPPPVGRGLVEVPKLRRIGPLNIAPEDCDALMRSLAAWLVAFAAAGAIIRWS